MQKFPFTPEGVHEANLHLYGLSDTDLWAEVHAVQADFKEWMTAHFDIGGDDLLFFKFLLVEKAGYNLKHRVAHSLMTFYEYHINLMNLLIMTVLKFGKYNFVATTKNEDD